MDNIQKIQSLEKKNSDNKLELAKLQEREKTLKEEKEKIVVILKELNLNESDLVAKIKELENDLNKQIEEIDKEIN
jgi:hypothetical protein